MTLNGSKIVAHKLVATNSGRARSPSQIDPAQLKIATGPSWNFDTNAYKI